VKARIVGDSQAQGAGPALRDELQRQGWQVLPILAKPGAGSKGVQALLPSGADPSVGLVVVFSGSVEAPESLAAAVRAAYPAARVQWFGSAPATLIGSIAAAQASWSNVSTADHWFRNGMAAEREARNRKLPGRLPSDFQYIDWRTLDLPGAVTQPSGVAFPILADGIHVKGDLAKAVAAQWPFKSAGLGWAGWVALGLGSGLAFAAWRRRK
jgi:hypothetical protein